MMLTCTHLKNDERRHDLRFGLANRLLQRNMRRHLGRGLRKPKLGSAEHTSGSRAPRCFIIIVQSRNTRQRTTDMTKSLKALLAGMPDIAYLPPSLRPQGASTKDEDQLDRIAAADPLGFLLALMNGHPVISFTVMKSTEETQPDAKRLRGRPKKDTATARIKIGEQNGLAIFAECRSPTIADRKRVAAYLAKMIASNGVKPKEQSEDEEFFALCERRAAQHVEEQN